MTDEYEPVIGLEVHARLLTKSKLFCSDPNDFGNEPNTLVSPVSLGHPGTLPFLNEAVLDKALMLGLACGCEIAGKMYFERKNYFYPDLPKGYQISQIQTPVCSGGFIEIESDGTGKKIFLNRIHLEEDAGKSIHDFDKKYSQIDLNRAGTPLVEIVTEPCIHSPEDAYLFLSELRNMVRFLEVCDGNLEEGSMRCDANISLRKKGEKILNPKVEVKNVNSLRFLKKAIEYEINRQAQELKSGNRIVPHTRSFDAEKGLTFAMRSKESADDYRYFPEPDLPPVFISENRILNAKERMSELPGNFRKRFRNEYGLAPKEAFILTEEKSMALYFDQLAQKTGDGRASSNWMLTTVKAYLNREQKEMSEFPVEVERLAELILHVKNGVVSHSAASSEIFEELVKRKDVSAETIARALNLEQQSDVSMIDDFILKAIEKHPEKVKAYRNGKKGLAGFFMGEIMKMSKGKLDPQLTEKLLLESLNKK